MISNVTANGGCSFNTSQVCGVDQCEGSSHIAGLSFCFFLGGNEHKTWTFHFVPLDFYEYKSNFVECLTIPNLPLCHPLIDKWCSETFLNVESIQLPLQRSRRNSLIELTSELTCVTCFNIKSKKCLFSTRARKQRHRTQSCCF